MSAAMTSTTATDRLRLRVCNLVERDAGDANWHTYELAKHQIAEEMQRLGLTDPELYQQAILDYLDGCDL